MLDNRSFLLLLLPFILFACAQPKKLDSIEANWPEDIPEYSYYKTLYSNDKHNQAIQGEDDYLKWIVRFYKGWSGFSRGWQDVTDELVDSVEPERKEIVRQKLVALGKQVSGEWAKRSDERLIYTKTLSIWGNALSESIYLEQVEPIVDSISTDADSMMSQQLQAEAITMKRYFPNLDFEKEFTMF